MPVVAGVALAVLAPAFAGAVLALAVAAGFAPVAVGAAVRFAACLQAAAGVAVHSAGVVPVASVY